MEQRGKQTRVTLVIVMFASFVTPFMSNAVNIAIPSIGIEFGRDQSSLNWVVSSFLLSTAAFLLPFGRLADRFGRKKVFLIGMIFLAASSLACALSWSLTALVVFRVLQGVASAMIMSNSMAILTSVVPPESRGKALGMNSAATYIGLSCGPVLGGVITSAFTWRGIFYANLLLALIIIAVTVWKLKGEWLGEKTKLDVLGIILCIFAQALLLFGLSDLTKGILYQICFISGVILLVIFFYYEKRKSNPLIPFAGLIKNRPFVFSNLATLINYSATFALSFVLSLYLQTALGISPAVSGLILLTQPILMAFLSPVAGFLSDRIKPAVLASIGMGFSVLGLFLFIFLGINTPIILIGLNLAFIGIGYALFASPNTNAIMSSIDRSIYGVASSVLGNMRLLGQSFSIGIVSLITSFIIQSTTIGSEKYVDELMISIRIIFIVFSVLSVFGVFASLARGKESNKEKDI